MQHCFTISNTIIAEFNRYFSIISNISRSLSDRQDRAQAGNQKGLKMFTICIEKLRSGMAHGCTRRDTSGYCSKYLVDRFNGDGRSATAVDLRAICVHCTLSCLFSFVEGFHANEILFKQKLDARGGSF